EQAFGGAAADDAEQRVRLAVVQDVAAQEPGHGVAILPPPVGGGSPRRAGRSARSSLCAARRAMACPPAAGPAVRGRASRARRGAAGLLSGRRAGPPARPAPPRPRTAAGSAATAADRPAGRRQTTSEREVHAVDVLPAVNDGGSSSAAHA